MAPVSASIVPVRTSAPDITNRPAIVIGGRVAEHREHLCGADESQQDCCGNTGDGDDDRWEALQNEPDEEHDQEEHANPGRVLLHERCDNLDHPKRLRDFADRRPAIPPAIANRASVFRRR